MKYFVNPDDRALWYKACKSFKKAYKKIEKHFPADFSKALLTESFHDSVLTKLELVRLEDKTVALELTLYEDIWTDGVTYLLTLKNIANIKMDFTYMCEWLYAEVLPVKRKKYDKARYFSLEIAAPLDEYLYVEFEKMCFQKNP
jgi:hypothetical protein